MSDTNEINPVGEAQAPVASPDLAAQLELLKNKNSEIIAEKRKVSQTVEDLQKQLSELQQNTQQQKQAKLAEQGEYAQLWKDASASVADRDKRIQELEAQAQEREIAIQQQTIKSTAVSAFTQQGVTAPDQLYALLKDQLRQKDGQTFVLHGGVERNLGEHLADLKNPGSGWEHHFAGSGARGMGSVGSTPTSSGGSNPYLTKNFSEIVRLETENPELAARLKAQANP